MIRKLVCSLVMVSGAGCDSAPAKPQVASGSTPEADSSGATSGPAAVGGNAAPQASRASAGATAASHHDAGTAGSAATRAAAVGSGGTGTDARNPSVTNAAAGSSGQTAAAAGNAASANDCSRELLQSTADAYFKALATHDPQTLPLADNAKFTENGEKLELGKAGLWLAAGALQHAHYALDTEQCSVVGQAVVPDDGTPIPVALRLKLVQQKITEIETIAVRKGDYTLASNTDALSASAMTVHWEDAVAPDQRNSRAELTAWMDKYFRMFPRGVCNTTSDCKRIENGGGSFMCSAGASCADAQPGPNDKTFEPRLILADVERGVGVGFTMFQTNTDMHMFKMYAGKVYAVSAILGKADSAGWP